MGAIRHNGFIPWDDDVDIMLDRKNYELFLKVIDKFEGFSLERSLWVYRIKRNNSDFAGVLPSIDVFVLDNAPDNAALRKIKVLLIKILQGMIKNKVDYSNYSALYNVCIAVTHLLGKLFTNDFKLRAYDKVSQISNNKETKYKTAYNDLFKYLNILYDKAIQQELELHAFEDTEFYVSSGYESYLTKLYGEWRTLPPIEERIPKHGVE